MKKSIFFIASLVLVLSISSCKKEVIEIVNEEETSFDVEMSTRSLSEDGSGTDNTGSVTDTEDDEDFDADKKSKVTEGE